MLRQISGIDMNLPHCPCPRFSILQIHLDVYFLPSYHSGTGTRENPISIRENIANHLHQHHSIDALRQIPRFTLHYSKGISGTIGSEANQAQAAQFSSKNKCCNPSMQNLDFASNSHIAWAKTYWNLAWWSCHAYFHKIFRILHILICREVPWSKRSIQLDVAKQSSPERLTHAIMQKYQFERAHQICHTMSKLSSR